jgi:hypothetical protein
MKNKLLLLAMGFALTTQMIIAQVPSYVPTNGLVGYWPFNGNANDESGNGNNGTVNGATLTIDRNGYENSAYSFDGYTSISVLHNISLNIIGNLTLSAWFLSDGPPNFRTNHMIVTKRSPTEFNTFPYAMCINYQFGIPSDYKKPMFTTASSYPDGYQYLQSNQDISNGIWNHIISVVNGDNLKIYLNGIIVLDTIVDNNKRVINNANLLFGSGARTDLPAEQFNGKLDDIAIYNRALTDQEITNLYNSVSSNECLTMTINTGVLSTSPVTYTSSVNIYPNPTNDQITIDCGNLANVVGWNIKITNMLGQEVFNQPMNTQQYVVPLNSWSGQGMYFVKIINAQNEVVNIKKIILQ